MSGPTIFGVSINKLTVNAEVERLTTKLLVFYG